MTRSKMVKVRVTEAEYADWKARAEKAGFSVSDAIRGRMASKGITACAYDGEKERQLTAFQYGVAVSDPKPSVLQGDWNPLVGYVKPAEGLTEAQSGIDAVIQEITHETANPYRAKHDEKGRRSEVCIHRMPAHVYCKVCDGRPFPTNSTPSVSLER